MTEIKDQRGPLSVDLCRLGKRLNGYLLAVKQITETFFQEKKKILLKDVDILKLLQKILPALRQSFNSEIAFLADQKGKIFFSDPTNAGIVGKELPDTPHVKVLFQKGNPLVVDNSSGDFPELRSLNVRSLMVVCIETPIEFRFIGVANGKNSPFPYLAEDRDFFNELIKIFAYGLDYGRKIKNAQMETKRLLFLDRYYWARLRGEWEYLSRASEDYAQHLLPIKMIGEEKQKKIANLLKMSSKTKYIDDVLADYLDAELCIYIGEASDSPTGSLYPEDDACKKKEPKSTKPWELFKPNEEGTGFKVILKDNNKETDEILLPRDYPHTALAAGRIYLFYANFRKVLKSASSDKSNGNEKDIYFSLYKNILKVVNDTYIKPIFKCDEGGDIIEGYPNYELHVDWLRLNWQYIYYRSCQGMAEPLEGYVERLVKTYSCIWKLTVTVLKQYLEEGTPETDLCIDSDWLIAWLACNVLLSKGLNEYYNLNPVDSEDIKAESVNPIAKMRYFKNLSHYILYVLHCARYAMRKKIHKIKDKKKAEQFKRPPFSDIPVEPTASLSKAQLYTMSEYAYREIRVHRELRIFERLSRQMYYELPLYAAGSFYRDHLYHVIDVCLLGELLLRSMMPGKGTAGKFQLLADQLTELPINDLLKNWYVAALCHDLGYVIEQADKFLKPIDEIKGAGISDFSGKVKGGLIAGKAELREIIKKIVIEDSAIIPSELEDKLMKFDLSTDHGVVGWLHLRQWINDVGIQINDLAPALTAILRHNLSDQKIDIHKEPLSFLLMLCDHLQEWGRPRVAPDPLASGMLENLRFSDKPTYDKKIRMRQVLVKGLLHREDFKSEDVKEQTCCRCIYEKDKKNCKSGDDTVRNHSCLRFKTAIDIEKGITFTLPHNEAREADFEPCISWLLFCRDLQSIGYNKEALSFPISIIFEHTPPHIWCSFIWKPMEMDIFEEYANAHSSATYLCEWIEAARSNKEEGIKYEADRAKGKELFTINLHELKKPLRRSLNDDHWKDFFKWKWDFLGQKYLKSNLGAWFPEQE